MSSGSRAPEHDLEFLPETAKEANELSEELRLVIAALVIELTRNAHYGELMGERPPRILVGCRKIRFDLPTWKRKPRYRLVYRNEPSDGGVANLCVLAIGRRDRMIAYTKAAARLRKRLADEGYGESA